MTFNFENEKQRKAAKIILKRCSGNSPPNKTQLAKLVSSQSSYKNRDTAISFVKSFIRHKGTPVTVSEGNVVREDLASGVVK